MINHRLLILLLGFSATAQSQQFTISTIAGTGANGYSGDGGSATTAAFNAPTGVALDEAGNLYVADANNNCIRKITPNGVVTTVAGTGQPGYGGDNGPATQARLQTPLRVITDASGNLYIADTNNNRVRKVTPDGIITTIAGNGGTTYSSAGAMATDAALDFPSDMAFDANGNLYVATNGFEYPGSASVVRKILPQGTIATVAGSGRSSYSGDDGPALNATLFAPKGLVFDASGNLLFSDQGNHRIRMVSNGIITTIAGTGKPGFAGDGGPGVSAQFNSPAAIAPDGAGNLYIADRDNGRIRLLSKDGTVTTVAGYCTAGFGGDGAPATDGALDSPRGVAFMSGGAIFVADEANNRIRLLTPTVLPAVTAVNAASFITAPVAAGSIASGFGADLATQTMAASGALSTTLGGTTMSVTDATGVTLAAPLFYVSPTQVNFLIPANAAPGIGLIAVTSGDGFLAEGSLEILSVAPGFFAAGNLALGSAIHVDAQGDETTQNLVDYNALTSQSEAVPIALGGEGDSTYLVLYGTGFRNAILSQVSVSVGGLTVAPSYAGLQPSFAGLDQVNLQIPNTLAGAGDITITLTTLGIASNTVHVTIQ